MVSDSRQKILFVADGLLNVELMRAFLKITMGSSRLIMGKIQSIS
ncbi:hypothetical protein V7O66_03165 [Methanolobus sp. ZRKC3]